MNKCEHEWIPVAIDSSALHPDEAYLSGRKEKRLAVILICTRCYAHKYENSKREE